MKVTRDERNFNKSKMVSIKAKLSQIKFSSCFKNVNKSNLGGDFLKDINLLPDDLRKNKEKSSVEFRDNLDPKLVLVGIVVAFIALVVFVTPILYNKILERKHTKIEEKIASDRFDEVRKVNKEMAAMTARLATKKGAISSIEKNTASVNEVLIAVRSILPQNSLINTMDFTGNRVTISGTLADKIQIGEIFSRVSRFNYFKMDDNASFSFNEDGKFNLSFEIVAAGGEGQ